MQLKSIEYNEWAGLEQEWRLHKFSLGKRNLLVGKNASGKSRTLNIINALAKTLLGKMTLPVTGEYACEFMHEGVSYNYNLAFLNREVTKEILTVNNDVLLSRHAGGEGTLFAKEENKKIKFQTPTSELAAVARRDTIQHDFLEPLHSWASTLRHYNFGSNLGKDRFVVVVPGGPTVDETDQDAVVGIFRKGNKELGQKFIDAIVADMNEIGYSLDTVSIGSPIALKFENAIQEILGLQVKERDLQGITDQINMSQGMYRVLALLIHVNYFQLKNTASCLLVDDIGEGLDFERSCKLINLLREKAENFNLQTILSTNDRFVMNAIPLEEWAVIQRTKNNVYIRNYSNSKQQFDEFKFTGLSNFSFLELDLINDKNLEND